MLGRRVLYDYPKGFKKCVEFGEADLDDAVYIADGVTPTETAGMRLLITCPRQTHYEEFKKDAISFYMPAPTAEQILLMRTVCFDCTDPELSDEAVMERMSRWGPVPRFVLSHVRDEKIELSEAFVKQLSGPLRTLLIEGMEAGSKGDVSFRIVHYDIDPDTFMRARYCWASPYIEEQVWNNLMRTDAVSRFGLLQEIFRSPHLLSVSGLLWEKWADVAMSRGSPGLPIRRLCTASQPTTSEAWVKADAMLKVTAGDDGKLLLPVPKASSVPLLSVDQLKQMLDAAADAAGTRYEAPRGFVAIDFWEVGNIGSNASVSKKHDIVMQGERIHNGLYPVVTALQPELDADAPFPFLWLVPTAVFPFVEAGSLTYPVAARTAAPKASAEELAPAESDWQNLNAATTAAKAMGSRVVQYAVCIPEPSAGKALPS